MNMSNPEILRVLARRKREFAAPMSGASKSAVLNVVEALEAGAEALEQAIPAKAICQSLAEIRDALRPQGVRLVELKLKDEKVLGIAPDAVASVFPHGTEFSRVSMKAFSEEYGADDFIVRGTVPEVLAKLRGES